MKFVILTDTHFVARGRRLYGLDPTERLGAAVERINRDHPDISFVIVTGDLAHWGEDAAYENLASVLARLNAPTILLMGNHDKRESFARFFPGVPRDEAGAARRHVYSAHDIDDVVQETWLAFVTKAPQIREPERVVGWLRTTATNLARRAAMRNARCCSTLALATLIPISRAVSRMDRASRKRNSSTRR